MRTSGVADTLRQELGGFARTTQDAGLRHSVRSSG
jgi:hypothetical protein